MSVHVQYGFRKRPSDAARWTRCHKSLGFTQDYPNESSEFADEGTVAHWVREMCLDLGFDAYDFIGTEKTLNGRVWAVDADMADHLQPGIDEIRQFDGEMFVEKWVDTTEWVGRDENGKPQGGTLDLGVVGTDLIVISDLKFGMGVPVDAVDNDQQILYALAFWKQIARHITKATNFLIIIDQPRNHAGGGYWPVTLEELLKRGEKIKLAAAQCDSPDAEFTPGEKQCKWCPAANVAGRPGGCPAHAKAQLDQLDLDFDGIDEIEDEESWQPPIVSELSAERLIKLAIAKKSIEGFLEYAHAQALQHLIDSGPSEGRKAVYGRNPPRKWRDEKAAEAFMRQKNVEPFNKKLKSPAQGEKLVAKGYEIPQALITQGDPKPVIVAVEDKRPAIRPIEDEFDDVEEDDLVL